MGPRALTDDPVDVVVFERGRGANVFCVDGNRYVDLAAGFGSLLLGHAHTELDRALRDQSDVLWQALGDLSPSTRKIELLERLARLHPTADGVAILGQSGADAITAALKTAMLYTGRPGVIAFSGSYHGLSYAPLAASDLRQSYRTPFLPQLSPHIRVVPYPEGDGERSLAAVNAVLDDSVGAILIEPILGRGGVIVPPPSALKELCALAQARGTLVIADEIWTGLGRSGAWLASVAQGAEPDLVCLGKGLGGGLPISACLGPESIMNTWSRTEEVVHTSTFAGAPLAAKLALETLNILDRDRLIARSETEGDRLLRHLSHLLDKFPGVTVRGRGLMIGIEVGLEFGGAWALRQDLLERGYLTTTGGGRRDVLVITPPLAIEAEILEAFATELSSAIARRRGISV